MATKIGNYHNIILEQQRKSSCDNKIGIVSNVGQIEYTVFFTKEKYAYREDKEEGFPFICLLYETVSSVKVILIQ
jgi:hypothetical protein